MKENRSGEKPRSNFPLNSGAQFGNVAGSLVSIDAPLMQYIVFAYKPNMYQLQSIRSQLPDWARSSRFDIQAKVEGNPSKDQMRAMMQALLADRFHMKVHFETRVVPVFALVLAKSGKVGSHLQPHPADDPACAKTPLPEAVAGAYPPACGAAASITPRAAGDTAAGGLNVTLETLAAAIGGVGNIVDRPVVDRTGLRGNYDFTIEFAPESSDLTAPGSATVSDGAGPSLTEALKEQLGLRLVPQNGPVEVMVVDKIERPTAN